MIGQLSSILEFKNGKKRPSDEGNIPIYGGNGILGYANDSNYQNCVAIGRVGAYCGSVYYESNPCWISDNAIAAIAKKETDIVYAYYLLKSLKLNERRIGTGQPLLTQGILNKITTNILPYEHQVKVGEYLGKFDRLIAQNERINENLFQQAQALYKDRFIDIRPLGGVMPTDWHLGTVSEIIELHDSKRIPLSSRERANLEKIYPYYGATSVMDYVDRYLFDGIYLLLGEDGTVVDSMGFPILQYVEGKFWVNNHAHIITGKSGFSVEMLFLLFSLTNVRSIVTGAVQPKISQANLNKVPVIIPSKAELRAFDSIVQPIFAQIRNLRAENDRLASVRDILLPRLMSGELDVSNFGV